MSKNRNDSSNKPELGGTVRKADSLPNVHFDEMPVIGSVFELPHAQIPIHNTCRSAVKMEGDNSNEGDTGKTNQMDSPGRVATFELVQNSLTFP